MTEQRTLISRGLIAQLDERMAPHIRHRLHTVNLFGDWLSRQL